MALREKKETEILSFRLDIKTYEQLKKYCEESDTTASQFARKALKRSLRDRVEAMFDA